jgi:acetylglutamate kinase
LVIKIGGALLDDAAQVDRCARCVAALADGGINKKLVGALGKLGQPAVGMCGGDGLSFRARKRQNGGADLGFVGEISSVDSQWLNTIWSAGGVPVIASLALGVDGEYYNINADQMAAACAVACGAARLAFLTDVNGVLDAYRCVIRVLPANNIPVLRDAGIISGGMLPKLEACESALAGGVGSVHILPGAQMEALSQLTSGAIQVGTELIS